MSRLGADLADLAESAMEQCDGQWVAKRADVAKRLRQLAERPDKNPWRKALRMLRTQASLKTLDYHTLDEAFRDAERSGESGEES